MNFETFFRLISYATVFCGFLSLWVSGSFGVIVPAIFLSVMLASWFLEDTRWQISEKVGTGLIVLALPAFIIAWRFQWFSVYEIDTEIAGLLARLILALSAVKLLQQKSARDWVFLYLMSFFEVMLAAGLSISGLYLLTFLIYLLVMVCAIIALEIRKAAISVSRGPSSAEAPSINARLPAGRLPVISFVLIIFISILAGKLPLHMRNRARIIGLVIAVMATRVRYEAWVKGIVFLPQAIAATSLAIIWRFVYSPDPETGLMNAVLGVANVGPVSLLGNPDTVNWALIAVGIWSSVGFATVILSAAIKGISSEVLEAARVDGATEPQIFWRIIVPMVSLPIAVVSVTLIVNRRVTSATVRSSTCLRMCFTCASSSCSREKTRPGEVISAANRSNSERVRLTGSPETSTK